MRNQLLLGVTFLLLSACASQPKVEYKPVLVNKARVDADKIKTLDDVKLLIRELEWKFDYLDTDQAGAERVKRLKGLLQ